MLAFVSLLQPASSLTEGSVLLWAGQICCGAALIPGSLCCRTHLKLRAEPRGQAHQILFRHKPD